MNRLITRRDLLVRAGMGFGAVAASSLLPAAPVTPFNPLAPKPPHDSPRAKAVIYLFMHGGVSHVDTWDPKPELTRLAGQPLPPSFAKGLKTNRIDFTKALTRGTPWKFSRHGRSGIEISELFPRTAGHVDDLAVIRSCYGDAFDHAPAIYLRNTGSQFPGRPCLGSWVVYGLGSENQNLPAFVVMSDGALKSGTQGYRSGFPARGLSREPVSQPDEIHSLSGYTRRRESARRSGTRSASSQQMDRLHLESVPMTRNSRRGSASYELAFRMQSAAPEAVDLSKRIRGDQEAVWHRRAADRRLRAQMPAGAATGGARRPLHPALFWHAPWG